ncbi:MAG TPA: chorismate synthase [Chloroflexota bacterium]|nr:chorismate synthase [Chloroflexota bacterium]
MSLGFLRVLTAGESHGPQLTIFVQNLPAGLPVLAEDINVDLARRQLGYGRGGRQQIEHDCVEIVAGVRHGVTMGGPITMVVKNRDFANWQGKMDIAPVDEPPPPVTRLRPGHADLPGVVKYGLSDVRNVLERASARETASRVAAGALGKVFLRQFGIEIRSHVRSIGPSHANTPRELEILPDGATHPWWQLAEDSPIRTGDKEFELQATELIKTARTAGDTLGGVFEVVAYGLPIGLGTYSQWDERLDGRLAAAVMSIQSIKAVELGDGYANAARHGSEAHDIIDYDPQRGWVRPTNRAGGLEGGTTNGAPLVVRGAAKPISTLIHPLPSIDYATREKDLAHVERSDVCVLPAAAVVGEAMVAIVLADAMRIKFGGDSLAEALTNYNAFQKAQER